MLGTYGKKVSKDRQLCDGLSNLVCARRVIGGIPTDDFYRERVGKNMHTSTNHVENELH